MVSLLHLAEITEQGVNFESPRDGARMLLTPEASIGIQNRLGAFVIVSTPLQLYKALAAPRLLTPQSNVDAASGDWPALIKCRCSVR